MNTPVCTDFEEELSHWLNDAWENSDHAIPESLAAHAEACASCRRRLNAALRLFGTEYQTPEGLSDTIIRRLDNAARPRDRNRTLGWVAAAALIFMLGTGGLIGFNSMRSVPIELFYYAPDASTVAVVGSWNGWDPERHPMLDSDGDGVWRIRLRLAPGTEHLYQFVIDDRNRIADPLSTIQVDDGFGGTNSVMNL